MNQVLYVCLTTSTPSTGVAKGGGGPNWIATNDKNKDNKAVFQIKFILSLLRSTVQY